jgi:hypothetical protein
MKTKLPTCEEINVYDSLDERSACKHFLGRTIEEAEALFRENSLCHQEDLMWMGPVAFRYYVQAAINYIQSPAATGDDCMIDCFAMLLEFRLEHERQELLPIAQFLVNACRYIITNYRRFNEADAEIYVHLDFRPRYEALIQNLSAD